MFAEILLILIFCSLWIGLFLILKQQGRILLRLDALAVPAAAGAAVEETPGLAVGEMFPSFQFEDMEGNRVGLDDFRGKRTLLVNWNPDCGFCDLVAPDLAGVPSGSASLNVVLMAHGTAEANKKLAEERSLSCPILLMGGAVPKPFETMGTPAAYLLDEEGRVARPVAIGSDAIPGLLRSVLPASERKRGAQDLAQSRIVRDGLKAGTPAPAFQLPDVYGQPVSLEDFRSKPLLLVFSDPHCGPCEELAPHLADLHRKHAGNGLGFLMIGRGDADENRRKAEQYGIGFPVVMQEKWKLSKEYGIFSTPVAFLIGEDGIIQKDVAVGVDGIKTLAQDALRKRKD